MPADTDAPLCKPRLIPAPPPSITSKLARAIWGLVQGSLFRWSPVPFHGWRILLLRLFGAKITGPAYIYPDVDIWGPWNLEMDQGSCIGRRAICYNVVLVKLEPRALVSQYAHLCTASHDINTPDFTLTTGPIVIGAGAWVAADAFVGPGVVIGRDAVIGARSVVMRDIDANTIHAGNPARQIGMRTRTPSPGAHDVLDDQSRRDVAP